jgi:hypothetical protein
MYAILLQVVSDAPGFRVEPAWVIATLLAVVSTLTGTIAFLYRGQIEALRERITWLESEGKHKDERTDRLIEQVGRAANVTDRSVSLAERERERTHR